MLQHSVHIFLLSPFVNLKVILNRFFIDFFKRKKKEEGERKKPRFVVPLPPHAPPLGIKPTTQTCAFIIN